MASRSTNVSKCFIGMRIIRGSLATIGGNWEESRQPSLKSGGRELECQRERNVCLL